MERSLMTFEQIKEAIAEFKIESLSKLRKVKFMGELRELASNLEEVDASEVTACLYPEDFHMKIDFDRGATYTLSLMVDWTLEEVTQDWDDDTYDRWLQENQPIIPEVEDVVHYFVTKGVVRIVNDW